MERKILRSEKNHGEVEEIRKYKFMCGFNAKSEVELDGIKECSVAQ